MFRTERRSHNSLLVEMEFDADFRRRFLLLADAHLDNPHCRRDLLKRHLDEAAHHNEGVIILGDLNDLMQGRDDPRRSKETLRPDYLLDYVDAVVDDTVAFLEHNDRRFYVKQERFSEEKIVGSLREAEKGEKPNAHLCRKHGIAEQTYYRWRRKYGGLDTSDVQRLKELTAENAGLKQLLAECDLEVDRLKELVAKNGRHAAEARGSAFPEGAGTVGASQLRASRGE